MRAREQLILCRFRSDDWWAGCLAKLNRDTARTLFPGAAMGWIALAASWVVAWVVR